MSGSRQTVQMGGQSFDVEFTPRVLIDFEDEFDKSAVKVQEQQKMGDMFRLVYCALKRQHGYGKSFDEFLEEGASLDVEVDEKA